MEQPAIAVVAKGLGWRAIGFFDIRASQHDRHRQQMPSNTDYAARRMLGYLITANTQRRWPELGAFNAMTFYRLRVARIVPCLLLVVVIVNVLAFGDVAILRNHAREGVSVPLWMVNLASLTFWMNVLIGRYGWVNYPLGVLWSLSVEEVFCLSSRCSA